MLNRTAQRQFTEPDEPFLGTEPRLLVARWTGWLLLGIFAAAVVFACTVKLPESVRAPFVLVPEDGADPIQSPLGAEVAEVRIRVGQHIRAGEELFTLRSDEIRNWQAGLGQLQKDQDALQEKVKQLEAAHETELAMTDSEIAQAGRELEFLEVQREASSNSLTAAETLAKADLLSKIELWRARVEMASSEKELVLGEKAKQQLLLQRQSLEFLRSRQRIDEAAEAGKLAIQIGTLRAELEYCVGDVKSVRAPYDAVVLSVRQRNAGNMVASGAELCQLARAGERPSVRLILPESGVPCLAVGQRLRLSFAAFPYQRYGTLPARLDWVSPAAVDSSTGPAFEAKATLLPAGTASSIKPDIGMQGEGRIIIGGRTLLQRLLEPLRMIRENIKEE